MSEKWLIRMTENIWFLKGGIPQNPTPNPTPIRGWENHTQISGSESGYELAPK